jgi:hypothetical protein
MQPATSHSFFLAASSSNSSFDVINAAASMV